MGGGSGRSGRVRSVSVRTTSYLHPVSRVRFTAVYIAAYRERERLSLRRGGFPAIASVVVASIAIIRFAPCSSQRSFTVALCVIKWRRCYTAYVLQRGSISPADKYNRARTPQETTHTHHSHHTQNHHDHSMIPMKKMKKDLEACKDAGHVSA